MHKFLAAIVFYAASVSAQAGPCSPLNDPEMKGMSVDELAAETCKASKINAVNYEEVMSNLDVRQGPAPHPNAQENFDQCEAKIDRMLRALRAKDVHEKVDDLCKRTRPATP